MEHTINLATQTFTSALTTVNNDGGVFTHIGLVHYRWKKNLWQCGDGLLSFSCFCVVLCYVRCQVVLCHVELFICWYVIALFLRGFAFCIVVLCYHGYVMFCGVLLGCIVLCRVTFVVRVCTSWNCVVWCGVVVFCFVFFHVVLYFLVLFCLLPICVVHCSVVFATCNGVWYFIYINKK